MNYAQLKAQGEELKALSEAEGCRTEGDAQILIEKLMANKEALIDAVIALDFVKAVISEKQYINWRASGG